MTERYQTGLWFRQNCQSRLFVRFIGRLRSTSFLYGSEIWRENDNTPPTGRYIASPYDSDARYATKRDTHWIGYKLHLTETYGDGQPNVITNVETTQAAVSDDAVTETIHASLAHHDLLPDIHVADTGYVNSTLFVSSQTTYGIDLIGPTRGDNHWQGAALGLCGPTEQGEQRLVQRRGALFITWLAMLRPPGKITM